MTHLFFLMAGCTAPALKPPEYSQLPSASPIDSTKTFDSYRQVGLASWYGPGFHGRKTASGERFNQEALTCAHRKLPFGTKLLVTHLKNNKSVVVVVNDRGPYVDSKIIDLSYAAAKELSMIQSGVAKVELKKIKVESTKKTEESIEEIIHQVEEK